MVPRKRETIAIADLENGETVIVPLSEVKPIAHATASISFEKRSSEGVLQAQLAALEECAQKAATAMGESPERGKSISRAFGIIGGTFSRSSTLTASKAYPKETRISEAEIRELAESALQQENVPPSEVRFESSVIRVELNGYPTSRPIGKRALTVSVTVLASTCEEKAKASIASALQKAFPTSAVFLRSAESCMLLTLSERVKEPGGSLIVSCLKDGTYFTAVRDDLSMEYAFSDIGSVAILERFGGLPEETLKLLEMVQRDECASPACQKLREAIAREEPAIARAFGEALGKIAGERKLPHKALLLAPSELSLWLGSFLSRIDFTQFVEIGRPLSVTTLESLQKDDSTEREIGSVIQTAIHLVRITEDSGVL